jgi:hypothetical protein
MAPRLYVLPAGSGRLTVVVRLARPLFDVHRSPFAVVGGAV